VRINDLQKTVKHALLNNFHDDLKRRRAQAPTDGRDIVTDYTIPPDAVAWIAPEVIRMLTWLLRAAPLMGMASITETALHVKVEFEESPLPDEYVRESLATGMLLDSGLEPATIDDCLNTAFPSLPRLATASPSGL